jgi:uncharacterized protein (UPF0332 family)
MHLARAEDELLLARTDYLFSTDASVAATLGIPAGKTFFFSVITHSYFAVFHATKAYLVTKGIMTGPPKEHAATLAAFRRLVAIGAVDKDLLHAYDEEALKADTLLDVLKQERTDRGLWTYNVVREANKPYALASIQNATRFVSVIKGMTISSG